MKQRIKTMNGTKLGLCAIVWGSLIGYQSPAHAACELPADFKMSRAIHYGERLLDCIKRGEDLPKEMRDTHLDTGKNIYGIFPKTVNPPGHENDTGTKLALTYSDLACYQTKAGGLSALGAKDLCEEGDGFAASEIPLFAGIFSNLLNMDMINCISGLAGALGNGGDFSSALSASGSITEGCASGSVGVCGTFFQQASVCPAGPVIEGLQAARYGVTGAVPQLVSPDQSFLEMNTSTLNISIDQNLSELRGATFYTNTPTLATVTYRDGTIYELELCAQCFAVIDSGTGNLMAGGPAGSLNVSSLSDNGTVPGIPLPPGTQITLIATPVENIAEFIVPENVLTGALHDRGAINVMNTPATLSYAKTAEAAYVPTGNGRGRTAFQQVTTPRAEALTGLLGQLASENLNINTAPEQAAGAFEPSLANNANDIINNEPEMPLKSSPRVKTPD